VKSSSEPSGEKVGLPSFAGPEMIPGAKISTFGITAFSCAPARTAGALEETGAVVKVARMTASARRWFIDFTGLLLTGFEGRFDVSGSSTLAGEASKIFRSHTEYHTFPLTMRCGTRNVFSVANG
jgi:hypothetical protein